MIWQVFWLVPSPADLPIRQATDSGLKFAGSVSGTYSYGDSAGFTPDFPFNDPPSDGSTEIGGKGKDYGPNGNFF